MLRCNGGKRYMALSTALKIGKVEQSMDYFVLHNNGEIQPHSIFICSPPMKEITQFFNGLIFT